MAVPREVHDDLGAICLNRAAPQFQGPPEPTSHRRSSPFFVGSDRQCFQSCFQNSRARLKSIASISIFPASIWRKSRMSLMTVSKEIGRHLPLFPSTARCSGERFVSSAKILPVIPPHPPPFLNGVRDFVAHVGPGIRSFFGLAGFFFFRQSLLSGRISVSGLLFRSWTSS